MQIMSAEFPSSRLAEGLLLHADRGEGILLRIYRMLKEMDDPRGPLSFLARDRPFPSLSKSLSSVTKGLHQFSPSSAKATEELRANATVVRKAVLPRVEVIMDAFDFLGSARGVLDSCTRSATIDATNAPDVAKLFLELASVVARIFILAARIEARKLLLVCVRHCCPEVFSGDDKYWRDIADFVGVHLGKPLVAAYEYYAPYRSSLKTALLSPLCLSLVKQRSSAEQWKKNEFMSVQSALAQAQEDLDRGEGLGVHPALENKLGIDVADLAGLERWFFYGLMLCHEVVDVTNKTSGEYRVWAMLLQGMWVAPVFREGGGGGGGGSGGDRDTALPKSS